MGFVINKATLLIFILSFWFIVYALFVFVGQSLSVPVAIDNIDTASSAAAGANAFSGISPFLIVLVSMNQFD